MKPNTCLVIDVWEGQLEIDEAVLKSNGVAGIGIRLNDMNGGHHMDTGFWKQWKEAVNFVRFPYFVYNPWVNGQQNFNWLAVNCPVEALTVAIDIEVRKPLYSAATYAAEVAKFLELCKSRWKVIIYTGQWFLSYLTKWPKNVDYWWAQYPSTSIYLKDVTTWIDLKNRLDNLTGPFNEFAVPGNLMLWQFSGDYLVLPGTTRKTDVNLFYGSEQDLQDYFGTGPDVPQVPVEPSGLYAFGGLNYYARLGGGPLVLAMSRVRGQADNMSRYTWSVLQPILQKLNATNPAVVDLIARPDWGPSKGLEGDDIKWIGLLWPGRNVVKIAEVMDGYGRVTACPLEWAYGLNVNDFPDLVHMVYDYNRASGYGERAKPVYIPILGGPWWVDMGKLVSIDEQLPKIVKIKAFPSLRIRADASADAAVVGYVYYGANVIVDQVKTGKGGIWGRVTGGWIALRNNGTNWTDWKI